MVLTGYFEEYITIDYATNFCEYLIYGKTEEEKENHKILCRCIGSHFDYINKGVPVKLEANLSTDNQFYVVQNININIDNSEMIMKYLTNTVQGLGDKTAQNIVSTLGPDIIFHVKETDFVDRLCNVKGVSSRIALELKNILLTNSYEKDVYEFLYPYGCDYYIAQMISAKYGKNSLNFINENPYILNSLYDVDFNICEEIAYKNNIPYDSSIRIKSIILNALHLSLNDGHTFIYLNELMKYVEKIYFKNKSNIYTNKLKKYQILIYLFDMKKDIVIIEENQNLKIYLKEFYFYEKNICKNLLEFEYSKVNTLINNFTFSNNGIQYSNEQKEAFNLLKTTGVKIITGGPGTGKTTTLKGLIKVYKQFYPNNEITLCSPTGRAAQRMKESIGMGMESKTICKLLNITNNSFIPSNNFLSSDFIIIDEVSMLDIEVANDLFNSIKKEAIVLLVGDSNQLPSVGSGNLLYDLIESKKFEVVELKYIFRQGQDSNIVANANNILNKNNHFYQGTDFIIKEFNSVSDIYKYLDTYSIQDLNNIQFLTPQRKSQKGCINQNKIIQDRLLENNLIGPKYISYNKTNFYINDKILFCKNRYKKNEDGENSNLYMNGDIGIIKSIHNKTIEILLNDEMILLETKDFQDIQLAYSMTIHKSQGSEYNIVNIILPNSKMLNSKILYTAITRAKEKVVLLVENNALETTFKNKNLQKRNSSLLQLLVN